MFLERSGNRKFVKWESVFFKREDTVIKQQISNDIVYWQFIAA